MDVEKSEHEIYLLFMYSLLILWSVHWGYAVVPEDIQWILFWGSLLAIWNIFTGLRKLVYKGRIPTGIDIAVICASELFFISAAHVFAALVRPANYRRIEKTSIILAVIVVVNTLFMLLSNILMKEIEYHSQ